MFLFEVLLAPLSSASYLFPIVSRHDEHGVEHGVENFLLTLRIQLYMHGNARL